MFKFPFYMQLTRYLNAQSIYADVPEGVFCGALPGKAQDINEQWHKELTDAVVSIPAVSVKGRIYPCSNRPLPPVMYIAFLHSSIHIPGSAGRHGLLVLRYYSRREAKHRGTESASVLFIPACPRTPANLKYAAGKLRAGGRRKAFRRLPVLKPFPLLGCFTIKRSFACTRHQLKPSASWRVVLRPTFHRVTTR
jgi:hypothetical protein